MNTIIEECWATHEAYRRLGIPADNIYVHVYLNVLVEARQGDLVFAIDIGVPVDRIAFVAEWRAFGLTANKECNTPGRKEYYQRILERSLAFQEKVSLVASMVLKGFAIGGQNAAVKNLTDVQ